MAITDDKLISDAARDIQLVEFAYKFEKGKTEDEKKAAYDVLPEGVELMMVTEFMEDTKDHDYRCAVFKNSKTKEIIFANAGTRANVEDLLADLRLGVGRVPWKGKGSRKTNEMVLASLGEDAANYQFHYTGHSLGAAMADIAASDMAVQLKRQGISPKGKVATVSFDNPGTKDIAERAYTQEIPPIPKEECEQDIEFNQINNRPNLVNTVNKQVGREHRIVLDDDRGKIRKVLDAIFQPILFALKVTSKAMELFVKPATYILDKFAHGKGTGAYIAAVLKAALLAPSKLVKVFSLGAMSLQVKSHLTHNFTGVLNKGQGAIRVADAAEKSTKRGYSKDDIAKHAVKTVSERLKEQGSTQTAYEKIVATKEEHLCAKDTPHDGRVDAVVVFDPKIKNAVLQKMENTIAITSAVSNAAKAFKGKGVGKTATPDKDSAPEIVTENPIKDTEPKAAKTAVSSPTKASKAVEVKEAKKAYKATHAGVSGKKAAKAVRAERLADKAKQQKEAEQKATDAAKAAREAQITAYIAEHPGVKRSSAKSAVRRAELKSKKLEAKSLKDHAATKETGTSRGR